MRQAIRISLLALMVSMATKPALARCLAPPTTTCSEAYARCMGVHCAEEHQGRTQCEQHCRPLYLTCLQTGEFKGRSCQLTGLIRK